MRLAKAEALQPGRGSLSLIASLRPELLRADLEYEQHVTKNVSAFASGWVSRALMLGPDRFGYGVLAGARVTF